MRRHCGTADAGPLALLVLLLLSAVAAADTSAASQAPAHHTQQQQDASSSAATATTAPHHPFLRHQPDPARGAGKLLPSDRVRLVDAWGMAAKDEREVVVPPAQEEATAAPAPECPKNSRFSYCAVAPNCAPTCEETIANGGAPVLKACNRMCYQRCECLPDHLLLEGFCVPQAACDRVRDARTPGRKREAIEEALEGFDSDKDQLMPKPDSPRPGEAGATGGGIRPRPGGAEVIDDVNDFLDSVTGGLWPIGEEPRVGAAVAGGGKDTDGRRGERLRYEWEVRQRQQGGGDASSVHIKYVVKEQQPPQQQQHQQHQQGGEREQEVVPMESQQQQQQQQQQEGSNGGQ